MRVLLCAGHYVSLIKAHGHWLFFDDEHVEAISEVQVQSVFGVPNGYVNHQADHGYILFYERALSGQAPGGSGHAPAAS